MKSLFMFSTRPGLRGMYDSLLPKLHLSPDDCEFACNTGQTLAMCEEGPDQRDVFIVDVMTGLHEKQLGIIAAIHAAHPEAKILAMASGDEMEARAKEAGADAFLRFGGGSMADAIRHLVPADAPA